MNKRSGVYRTNLSRSSKYKSFVPNPLPPKPQVVLDNEMISLLVKANRAISALESISSRIPDMGLFVSMYVRKEALMSSQIEGTQATLEDVFDPRIENNANRNVIEVINYIKATEYAIKRLNTLPLCNRLIKDVHKVLMKGVRGQGKSPGAFRHSQNWIGGQGSTIKTARYIPPSPDDMAVAMSDLEKYMNSDDNLDYLIRAALIHYQFETIHPFLDGNGRVGRLLITLFLMEKKILTTPALYISYFLKENRIEYYDRMTEVRLKGNYEQWISFFLIAITQSAQDAVTAIDKMTVLQTNNREKIRAMGRVAKNTLLVFEYLASQPIIDIGKVAEDLNVSYNTVAAAVKRLMKIGVLSQTENTSRNRSFAYRDYLDILRKGT